MREEDGEGERGAEGRGRKIKREIKVTFQGR